MSIHILLNCAMCTSMFKVFMFCLALQVRVLCTQLLTSYPAQDFVVVTLSALTQLTAATLVDIPQQVFFDFLKFL